MNEWTMGQWGTLMLPVIILVGIVVSWLVNKASARWGDNIAGFTILVLVGWLIMCLLMWNEPVP